MTAAPARPRSRKGRPRTTVATRLAVSALVVSVTSLAIITVVLATSAQQSGEELLRGRVDSVSAAKAAEVEAFLTRAERQLAGLAMTMTAREGVRAFSTAYAELASASPDEVTVDRGAIGDFYLDEFIPRLEAATGQTVDPLVVDPGRDPATAHLQAEYIAENPLDLDQKALLTDAEDGSAWTDVHRELHPQVRAAADGFDWDDILFVDAGGDIVYSVRKDTDFATDLGTGPYRNTPLARLVSQVQRSGEPGTVLAADLSHYAPALGEPVLFLGTPVVVEGADDPAGVMVARVGVEHLNDIMTQDWREGLLGETGETYLVGADRLMRSDARLFAEDPSAYLQRAEEAETATADERRLMRAQDSTALIQTIDNQDVLAAIDSGESGLEDGRNYLDEEVVTAYRPVDTLGLPWAVVSEQSQNEVLSPVDSLLRTSLTATAVFVVALTFVIVIWANRFVSPVRAVSTVLKRVEDGNLQVRITPEGPREFRQLARGVNQMISDLEDHERRVKAAMTTKVDLIRRLLPPAAAQRVGTGDRRLLESVPQATVTVLVIDGLNVDIDSEHVERNRGLVHRVLDELDQLAGRHGLERVKVLGDTYHAACGLSTPYLDHTPRAVTFAMAARDVVREAGVEESITLSVRGGVQCGRVTVGLIGHSRLVYDLWGDTVETAQRLANYAEPEQILVSKEARERLPADYAVRSMTAGPTGGQAWLVEGAPATAAASREVPA